MPKVMALTLQHGEGPIIVQSDSSKSLATLSGEGLDRSVYVPLVAEFILRKRDQNRVADRLASNSRNECNTIVWLHRRPPCLNQRSKENMLGG